MYKVIASANIVINTDASSLSGDEGEINQLIGEAYMGRALAHFDLLMIYGQQNCNGTLGVPYVTEYKGDDLSPARNTVSEVEAAVESDLNSALSYMSEDYEESSKEYFSINAVYAFMSRFYLYMQDWESARDAAAKVINSGEYSILSGTDYISSWSADEPSNSIFELAYSSSDYTSDSSIGNIYYGSSYGDIEATSYLYGLFEDGDVRVDEDMFTKEYSDDLARYQYRNVGKYPSVTGDLNITIFRYEEVILNYAEALWRINNSSTDALTYLNMIPENRDASDYTEIDEDNIMLERQKELAFEGLRFFDLMRTGSDIPYVDENQTYSTDGISYGDEDLAFPIPESEVNANSDMVQNDGY